MNAKSRWNFLKPRKKRASSVSSPRNCGNQTKKNCVHSHTGTRQRKKWIEPSGHSTEAWSVVARITAFKEPTLQSSKEVWEADLMLRGNLTFGTLCHSI